MEEFLRESGFIIEKGNNQHCVGVFKFAGNCIRILCFDNNSFKARVVINDIKWNTHLSAANDIEGLKKIVSVAFQMINWKG